MNRLVLEHLFVMAGRRTLVEDVSLELGAGRVVALVGASGSGKTLTSRALLGLVDVDPGVVTADLTITVDGRDFRPYAGKLPATRAERDRRFAGVRGRAVGYLPQDARAALDPVWTVGRHVDAVLRARRADGDASPPAPDACLRQAGLPDAAVLDLYPHALSGGMAQRVMIALALARGSRFLLADEPTSALDPTIAAEVLAGIRALAAAGIGVLLVTHDLRVLPGLADELLVMDCGRIVERATPEALIGGRVTDPASERLLVATRRVAGGRLG